MEEKEKVIEKENEEIEKNQDNDNIVNETENTEKEEKIVEPSLEEKCKSLEESVLEWKKAYAIKLSDFENYKKRKDKEFAEYKKYACESLIQKQIQNMDVLKMAIESAKSNHDIQNLLEGIEMIYTTMENTLKEEGVEEVVAEGSIYDPYVHYAVSTVSDENLENDTVVQVLQKGYILKGKVIRPAMVTINKK